MKKHFLLLSTALFMLPACTAPVEKKISDEMVTTIASDFFVALETGDTTLMKSLLTEDFEMFEHDVVWNVDSLLSLMPNTLGRKWSIVDPVIQTEAGIAHIYYFNQGINPSDRSWYESMLLESTETGPKIKFMHSTKLYLK
ncbi:hypothetical protein [Roseivirga sp. E12]|uniref:hypothetical protein n=1 Tax=Roseivirga sp. E12 TaxID=2819237 RepID=UPI001ABD1083|nr:hypothetical protein [Roseivirga sp. E12]MBO3697084.1 hypothetical protein [Roseivirga sp. E12]